MRFLSFLPVQEGLWQRLPSRMFWRVLRGEDLGLAGPLHGKRAVQLRDEDLSPVVEASIEAFQNALKENNI